jgi:DNA-binding NtrC family response regulator
MTMLGRQSANAASHSSPEWEEDSSRLTTIVRDLVGYTLEEVERELILNSLDQYGGSRTYTANVLGISIRCLRNKITQYAAMGRPVTAPGQRMT